MVFFLDARSRELSTMFANVCLQAREGPTIYLKSYLLFQNIHIFSEGQDKCNMSIFDCLKIYRTLEGYLKLIIR